MKIKEKLKQFGILVIRLIWPWRAKKGIQRLGVFILGFGLMIGVTQAGTLQRALMSVLQGETSPQDPIAAQMAPLRNSARNASVTADVPQTPSGLEARSGAANIVDLIGGSELIMRGVVMELSDGFENGVPYTQVKVRVRESLRGKFGAEYSFRQFGLLQPRKMDNGKVNLNVTPEGWAKYKQNEEVVLFLHKKAKITNLRTTTGLGQGKISVKGGNVESGFSNAGLFENVEVDQKLVNDRDKRLLGTRKGALNTESFMSFVRRAVKDKWVEGGKLRHAKK